MEEDFGKIQKIERNNLKSSKVSLGSRQSGGNFSHPKIKSYLGRLNGYNFIFFGTLIWAMITSDINVVKSVLISVLVFQIIFNHK